MNEVKVPFLLCIPVKVSSGWLGRGDAIEKLAQYQKEHYGTNLDLKLRAEPGNIPLPEISTEELSNTEIDHIMRQAPSRRRDNDGD